MAKLAPTLSLLPLLALTTFSPVNPRHQHLHYHPTRQVQMCKVEYCYPAYNDCVQDCDSLAKGDCFDVQTSPQCEACNVELVGCAAGTEKGVVREGVVLKVGGVPERQAE